LNKNPFKKLRIRKMNVTREFIANVFRKSKIDPRYLDVLVGPEAIAIFQIAFTSPTVDLVDNYEIYEYIGDVAANAAVVMYFYNVFPQLRNQRSINILNRLKIVHVSKESYSKIAEDLGFQPYIRYDENVAAEKPIFKKSREALLEDIFEAFVGATQSILMEFFGPLGIGVASQIIYNFIKPIFDAKDISFEPNVIYDAKTRLKELFERRKDVQNKLLEVFGLPNYQDAIHPDTSTILRFQKSKIQFFGKENSKQQSQKSAAQQAINYFKESGYDTEKKFNNLYSSSMA
jgi:dsRNA-specific ribonuclease